jgi:hypothetical protein
MFEFNPELDKIATHTALRMRNNVLPLTVWQDALGLPSEALEGLPSPITYGRLKWLLTAAQST